MVVSGLLLMSNLCVLSQKHYWKEHVLEKTLKYKKKNTPPMFLKTKYRFYLYSDYLSLRSY